MVSLRGLLSRKELAVAIAIIIVAALGGWFVAHQKQEKKASEIKIPQGWTTYRSASRGFQFSYPKDWGTPVVNETSGQRGKAYAITLSTSKVAGQEDFLTLTMESDDFQYQGCPTNQSLHCSGLTGMEVKQAIDSINKLPGEARQRILQYESDSYSSLIPDTGTKAAGGIQMYQIVGLPNINVTAIRAQYRLFNVTSSCPADQLAPDSATSCITRTLSNNLSRVLKSFRPYSSNDL